MVATKMVNNKAYRGYALRTVVVTILVLLLAGSAGAAATLTVCPSGCVYSNIQSAIDAASNGDTILVQSGTYNENVNVDKQLTLRGIGMPVVNAGGSENAITLAADGIRLEGFTATGGGHNVGDAGILITSNNNTLSGNNASSNNNDGIHLYSSSNNTINGNKASNNIFGINVEFSDSNTFSANNANLNDYGIRLYSSIDNTLSGNNANSNIHDGITFDTSSNNMLLGNNASSNIGNGIHLSSSSKNMLSNNNASNNENGLLFDSSSDNMLSSNNASNNNNGIMLYYSNNNTMSGNNASSNTYSGIRLSFSNDNTLSGNNVWNNSYGIFLYSSSKNTIYNNYFNNTNNAIDIGGGINNWNITKQLGTNIIGGPYLGGNFWSNYAGVDINGDGLGDTLIPYNNSGSIKNSGDYLPLTLPPAGNVTGGGWIISPIKPVQKNNNKATFGFEAHFVNGIPTGNLEYIDHVNGMNVQGNVTTLSIDKAAMNATFSGTAKINGIGAYAYTVKVHDGGEPGRMDTFAINITAKPYAANGTLGGGNIQIHEP
jgi:nitrous oxidase accessory protein